MENKTHKKLSESFVYIFKFERKWITETIDSETSCLSKLYAKYNFNNDLKILYVSYSQEWKCITILSAFSWSVR